MAAERTAGYCSMVDIATRDVAPKMASSRNCLGEMPRAHCSGLREALLLVEPMCCFRAAIADA